MPQSDSSFPGLTPATYQMTTLTPALVDTMIRDGSPQIMADEFWSMLNTELMTANLSELNIHVIMYYADLVVMKKLSGIPEDEWEDVKVLETVWDIDPVTKKRVQVVVRIYSIVDFMEDLPIKVYIKCQNSKEGHLIKALTEQNIKQVYEERGTRPEFAPTAVGPTQEEKKKGWGL